MVTFQDWLLKEEASLIQGINRTPKGIFVKVNNQVFGPVEKAVSTSFGKDILYLKLQNSPQPILANLQNVPQDIKQKFIQSFTQKLVPQKQAPFQITPQMQTILVWPTAKIPHAPIYWEPKYMEMSSDRAQKLVSNELLQKGMPAAKAMKIGHDIADFVWNYSAYPYNVYKRVLAKLGDENPDVNQEEAIQKAKEASEKAAPFHKQLMTKGYQ